MTTAICVLSYLFTGCIVAIVFLAWSILYNPKHRRCDNFWCFILSIVLWWFVLAVFLYYGIVKPIVLRGRKREDKLKLKDAFDTSKICNKYEYDESGLRKIYGWCCATCVNANRKECPKTEGNKK